MTAFRRVAAGMWERIRGRRARSAQAIPSHQPSPAGRTGKPRVYSRESSQNLYDGVDLLRQGQVERMHQHVIDRIRQRLEDPTQRLQIGFLVSSAARWNGDSLLGGINRDPRMSASLFLAAPEYRVDRPAKAKIFDRQVAFFRAIDPDLTELYDPATETSIPVEDTDCDVLFLEMPWGMKDAPRRVAGHSLPVYMHYGFMMMANHEMHYNIAPFHSYLWTYYTQTEGHRRMHLHHDPSAAGRLEVTGYPKLDAYADPPPTDSEIWDGAGSPLPGARRVIYAPHHSLGADNLGMSTFDWSGPVAQELMLQHAGIHWLYKPHPTLRFSAVRNNLMSGDDYEAYEQTWVQAPNATVYDSGRYFDAFRTSDALITCSGSFLAEYLPTGRPIIWLVSERTVGLNDVGTRLADGFYKVRNPEELAETFERVIVRGEDPLAETRAARTAELFPRGARAADAILAHLRRHLIP